jgi:membrane peptidoglycan carboxypeptidase
MRRAGRTPSRSERDAHDGARRWHLRRDGARRKSTRHGRVYRGSGAESPAEHALPPGASASPSQPAAAPRPAQEPAAPGAETLPTSDGISPLAGLDVRKPGSHPRDGTPAEDEPLSADALDGTHDSVSRETLDGAAESAAGGAAHDGTAAGAVDDLGLLLHDERAPLRERRSLRQQRALAAHRHRRRFVFYRRHNARARQAARRTTITRLFGIAVLTCVLLIVAVVGGGVAMGMAYYHSQAGMVQALAPSVAGKDSVRIYDDKGTLLYQMNRLGAQHSIPLARIPVDVVNATVAIEDHDFWINTGIDFQSIVRAATQDLAARRITQGGSTITQQLIKDQIVGADVTFQRKIEEAILAVGITESGTYTKSQILEMYLNSVPYSPTAYGIDAAAQHYFGYTDNPATGQSAAQQLDLAQASMLAGIPQNPNQNDPLLHPQAAHARQGEVLKAMVQYGYITQAQANAAWQESLRPNFFHVGTDPNKAPQFVYYVINELQQMVDSGQLRNLDRAGLNVYTTLDLNLQNEAQQAMRDHLYGNDQTGYCCGLIRNANVTNAAEIMVDQHTGAIKVYQGSIDYYSNQINGMFDVVSQGFRGPGSAFKPFAYAMAMERGWFPALTVGDVPTTFWDAGAQTVYKPLDYDTTHMNGTVTLRTALDWSLNVPAVKVMQYAGVENVKELVARMGITRTVGTWGLSSVLGAIQVTPFEMAQAYTVFANYGQFIPLHGINQITDSSGNVLYTYQTPAPIQVLDPRIAFLITSILSDNASRAGDFGPCTPLYLAEYHGRGVYHFGSTEQSGGATSVCANMQAHHFVSPNAWPTAAKTGTGQDFRDDWTVGYTMDYTTAVWVGNNDDSPMRGIDGVTGAAPIFYESMLYAEESQNLPKRPFPVPQGVHQAYYCSQGVCTTDWFLNGQTPPPNLGESGRIGCVAVLPTGGWKYGPPCQISLESKLAKNNGAPPPVAVNGQMYVGGYW